MDTRFGEIKPSQAMLSILDEQFKKHAGQPDNKKSRTCFDGFFKSHADVSQREFVVRKLREIAPEYPIESADDIQDLQLAYLMRKMLIDYRPFAIQLIMSRFMIEDYSLRVDKFFELRQSVSSGKWQPLSDEELRKEAKSYPHSDIEFEEIQRLCNALFDVLMAPPARMSRDDIAKQFNKWGLMYDSIKDSINQTLSLGTFGALNFYSHNKSLAPEGGPYLSLYASKAFCLVPMILCMMPSFMMARDYTAPLMLCSDVLRIIDPDILEVSIYGPEGPGCFGDSLFRMSLGVEWFTDGIVFPSFRSSPKPELVRYFIECNAKCAAVRTESGERNIPFQRAISAIFAVPKPDDYLDTAQAKQWVDSLEGIVCTLLDNGASFDEVYYDSGGTVRDFAHMEFAHMELKGDKLSELDQYKSAVVRKLLNYEPKLQSEKTDADENNVSSFRM